MGTAFLPANSLLRKMTPAEYVPASLNTNLLLSILSLQTALTIQAHIHMGVFVRSVANSSIEK